MLLVLQALLALPSCSNAGMPETATLAMLCVTAHHSDVALTSIASVADTTGIAGITVCLSALPVLLALPVSLALQCVALLALPVSQPLLALSSCSNAGNARNSNTGNNVLLRITAMLHLLALPA